MRTSSPAVQVDHIWPMNPLSLAGEGRVRVGATRPERGFAGPTTLTPTLSRQREREAKPAFGRAGGAVLAEAPVA